MFRRSTLIVTLIVAELTAAGAVGQANPTDWGAKFYTEDPGGAFLVGVHPDCGDGYDGQSTVDVSRALVFMSLYRENGPDWTGPTGFYYMDFGSPIASGTSKTWNDIRLWAHNYTPYLGDREGIALFAPNPAPHGYWAELVLDYVPASLNYAGPMRFAFSLDPNVTRGIGYLPVQIITDPTDPTQVTRMHLTVYAPEPSSAAAILAGLAGFGAVMRRRRKR
jgi:hypothetical protein